jgi:hypothetical protein
MNICIYIYIYICIYIYIYIYIYQAAVVGNMVVVIQNKQSSIISEFICQDDSLSKEEASYTVNGQNPLSAALAAAAQAIGGLAKAQSGKRRDTKASLYYLTP